MPTYAARCVKCKREIEFWAKIAERNDTPEHCGVKAERIINAPMVAPIFDAYRAIAGDRRYIRTRQEHKDFLREFGYEEVGNDTSYYPTETDEEREVRERDTYNSLNEAAAVQSTLGDCENVPGEPG
jgi:hypothetical protein